ncbi:hypothetical protein ERJ75_001004800 [Trypanosoma vivax]|uniref:Transmembrane protein n=1 Tax=Trypanosoma vivax (strain Y486) TaxID=1055687 RepID=G0TYG8_TRYVY|nr:hypothetical protein TRVL_03439 [Trypanosoma vivax]KAH8612038.1 hypothetical protein ERJ75_001004800 [Trypanosoma vivax]CCC49015.1 conserved hypothetical protein [Trypanosoma vivax Y486]
MLRRANPLGCVALKRTLPTLSITCRHGHHPVTRHDFTGIFSRPLTMEEEVALKQQQEHRPVSAVVPGKVFMRHWIAGEQATLSVVNRVVSGFVTVCLILWSCGYAALGCGGYTCAHVAGWMFMAYWFVLQTHVTALVPVFAALGLFQLLLN